MGIDNIDDEVALLFANALSDNNTMETLWLTGRNHHITERGWAALSGLLCNKSSPNGLFSSNHSLKGLFYAERCLPSDIVSSLQMNANSNKFQVARQKILRHYFMNGNANIGEFAEMEWKVLPFAIAWAGSANDGLLFLYMLFQSMPSLFDADTKKTALGRKRRRIR